MVPHPLLDRVNPFHVVLDRDLCITQAGPAFLTVVGGPSIGRSLLEIVTPVRPPIKSVAEFKAFKDRMLLMRLTEPPLTLRAQLLDHVDGGFLLVSTPWVTNEVEFERAGLHPGLAAPHESWSDFFMHTQLIQQQNSDLERILAQLEEREARLRAIIDTAVDAIITIEETGRIESANPAVEQLFGYAPEELIGVHIRTVLLPAEEAQFKLGTQYSGTEYWAARGLGLQVKATRKDGSGFSAELAVSELIVRGKKLYTGIVRDISERKKVERLQTEFVATVSHELRTPLTCIQGSLELVCGGATGPLTDMTREYTTIALSNSHRLLSLVNDLLDIEKIQSGKMDFFLKKLNLAAVVRAAVSMNTAFVSSHHAKLELVGEPPDGEVIADEGRLAQVLANLISNAAKFSPAGATVQVSALLEGERFCVSVRDYGSGIPEEFRNRIFDRFAQADSASTRDKGGTGLGLSITKAIIEKLHGEVGFEPAEGGGTRFYFYLPVATPLSCGISG